MNNDERLREALLELEVLRRREAERSRESNAILSALEAMSATDDAAAGITALLASIQDALGCALVALFDRVDDTLQLRFPDHADLKGLQWAAPGLVAKKRRIVDLHAVKGLWDDPPAELMAQQSLLSVPIGDGHQRMVLVAFSTQRAAFNQSDAGLLQRLATIASQAIIQRTLEERSTFLSAVIDASPVSVAIANVQDDMPLVYVNDAFTTLTGFKPEEVIGENCRFMSAEAEDSDVRRAIRTAVADRTEGTFILQNRRKSGEVFWNELRLFPIHDADGTATQIVATQTDATTRINAEIERDNAHKRLEGALGATADAFLIVGARGTIRFANAVFQQLFGEADFVIGQDLTAKGLAVLLDDPTLASEAAPISRLARPVNREISARNGRRVLLRGRPIQGGGAVIAATDITQSKVNEQILKQRLAAIEMSQDGIAIGDPEGRILHANPSLVALLGLPSEAHGLGRMWSSFYDRATQDRFEAQKRNFARKGVWRDEATLPSSSSPQTHDVSISRVPDVGTVMIVRDITERQHEEEERNRLRRQLDRARMQDQMNQISAGLAHDFNNLLSAILGSANLIDILDDIPQPARKAANRIRLAAEKAAELVDGFLDLGMRERKSVRLNLGDVVLTTVDLARGSAPAQAQLNTSICIEPVWVEASQTDLLQVLMNLIVNGLDALDRQSGEVRVSLLGPEVADASADYLIGTPQPDQRYAAIKVEDTGHGMPDDTIAKMLDPYFTTKGNEGTGLGLAIVMSTLTANGCLLMLHSVEGQGTCFTVFWPVDDVAAPALQAGIAAIDRRGLPIMVVDDQVDVAAAIAADLTAAGFEVAETSDPEAALEAVLEDSAGWGAVVTDYDMPKLTGGDLVARLSKDVPDLPVIVVSALAKRIADVRVKAASAVLSKPVLADKLVAEIHSAQGAGVTETEDENSTGG